MAVSVRMDPLLERELEQAARRQGVTKSQFIIAALEKALGRKNPYDLLLKVQQDMDRDPHSAQVAQAFADEPRETAYDTQASRAALIARLRAKHGLGTD